MKILDRYLTRELFFPIFVISVSLVLLFVIADLFDNIDLFLNNKVPASIMIEYYLNLIPFSYVQIACWGAWLGTVYLLIQLGMHNEMTAMKAAGLDIRAIVKPILFLGFLIGIFVFITSELIVPPTHNRAKELMDVYIEKSTAAKSSRIYKNLTHNAGDRLLVYFRKFSARKNVAVDVVILKWDDSLMNTYEKFMAKKAHYNGESWDFYDVTTYQTDSQGKILGQPQTVKKAAYPEVKVRPEELLQDAKDPADMSIFELRDSIQAMKQKGIDAADFKVQFYQRLALPWQSFLMIFFTLPTLGTVRSRKALASMILKCLVIIFAYHVSGAVLSALGKSGKIWPLLGAWAHHVGFFCAMLFNLDRANHE